MATNNKQAATFSRWSLAKYPEPVSLLHGYPETTLAGLARVHSYVSHNNVDLERPTAGGRKIKGASENTASKKKPQEPCLDNRLSFAHQFGFMSGKKSIPVFAK